MRGKRARIIRKQAQEVCKGGEYKYLYESNPSGTFKRVYRHMKKMYNQGRLEE